MKKTVMATALLVVFGGAHAYDIKDGAVGPNLVEVGPTTIGGFHGPLGAPGIGAYGSGDLISLQSIEFFTFQGYESEGGYDFGYYQLEPGFIHTNPQPGETALPIGLDGIKLPELGKNVYFGLASVEDVSGTQHQAWYVGDQDGFVLPTTDTDYAAVALLALPSTAVNAPEILKGELSLSVAGTPTLSGTLSNAGHNLKIDATGNSAFTGTSTHYVSSAPVPGTSNGVVSGHFFGGGATGNSGLAGVAEGNAGSYVASFGGVEK